eukprot:200221-Amphidinium_carterae.1
MARTAPDGYIRLLAENCDSVSPVYYSIFEVRWGSQSRNAPGGAFLLRKPYVYKSDDCSRGPSGRDETTVHY